MTATNKYRDVEYSIANNDDGVWRWIVYPKKSRRLETRTIAPRPTSPMRDAAAQAAKAAIDTILDGKSVKKIVSDTAGKHAGDTRTK